MKYSEFQNYWQGLKSASDDLLEHVPHAFGLRFHHDRRDLQWDDPDYTLDEYIHFLRLAYAEVVELSELPICTVQQPLLHSSEIKFSIETRAMILAQKIDDVCVLYGYSEKGHDDQNDGTDRDDNDDPPPQRPDLGGKPSGQAIALPTELAV